MKATIVICGHINGETTRHTQNIQSKIFPNRILVLAIISETFLF